MVSTATRSACARSQAREFAESFVPEDDVLRVARGMSAEVGVTPISAGTGAMLRMLAAATSARAVVEIGTGTGVSGLWLLRGMRPDGVLTTIDIEPEHQRVARRIFAEAGHAASRTRLITGRALDVLPRLADAPTTCCSSTVTGPTTPLRRRGPAAAARRRRARDQRCAGRRQGRRPDRPRSADVALREWSRCVPGQRQWSPALVPVGDGLLCAVRA